MDSSSLLESVLKRIRGWCPKGNLSTYRGATTRWSLLHLHASRRRIVLVSFSVFFIVMWAIQVPANYSTVRWEGTEVESFIFDYYAVVNGTLTKFGPINATVYTFLPQFERYVSFQVSLRGRAVGWSPDLIVAKLRGHDPLTVYVRVVPGLKSVLPLPVGNLSLKPVDLPAYWMGRDLWVNVYPLSGIWPEFFSRPILGPIEIPLSISVYNSTKDGIQANSTILWDGTVSVSQTIIPGWTGGVAIWGSIIFGVGYFIYKARSGGFREKEKGPRYSIPFSVSPITLLILLELLLGVFSLVIGIFLVLTTP